MIWSREYMNYIKNMIKREKSFIALSKIIKTKIHLYLSECIFENCSLRFLWIGVTVQNGDREIVFWL